MKTPSRREFIKTLSVAAAAMAPRGSHFNIHFTLHSQPFTSEKLILQIPGVLTVNLRQHDPQDRKRQNYPAFKMPDGSVPVLEATLTLHSAEHPDWQNMAVGIPLAMLNQKAENHQVTLYFSGIRWSMYVDGRLLDNDFPFGSPDPINENSLTSDPQYVSNIKIDHLARSPKTTQPLPPIASQNLQYWIPPGHNSWVGDVVTLFHHGRYHIFYLFDRRHHQSKFGKGAHYFEHISTTDFQTWIQHEAATPIDEQWECIGTGTPFVFNNKLCLSYGLHTGRIYPDDKTTWPAQWDYLKQHGRTAAFNRAAPGVPAGATYSVSADGVANFHKTHITFHPCQNPSVYIDPEGRLRMLANAGSNGIWQSQSINEGWQCINPGFPPGGDCTFFFRWGAFDYIIGGFTGLWRKPANAPDSAYLDLVHQGLDFYDGSNVPSITQIFGGRFVMAAWIPIRGWGGPLVLRELIQLEDGRIASRWLKEVTPPTQSPKLLAATLTENTSFTVPTDSFLLTGEIHPTQPSSGKLAISFQQSCEWQINLADLRAQFAPASPDHFAPQQKSLREGAAPQNAADYAIENLTNVNQPFAFRILVKSTAKLGGSLIDAEIASHRTMLNFRPDLLINSIHLRLESLMLQNLTISALA